MRKPAKELFEALPVIGGDRWNDEMRAQLHDLVRDYGHLQIGSYDIGALTGEDKRELRQRVLYAVAQSTGDIGVITKPGMKLVIWLLGGKGGPPGLGSLGKLKITGTAIVGRPGFSTNTLKWRTTGLAKRHITPWHSIRTLLNKLVPGHPDALMRGIDRADSEKHVHPGDLKEAVRLLLNKPRALLGELPDVGTKVLMAAFIMNSRLSNLWAGGSGENSEIATLSKNYRRYIATYEQDSDVLGLIQKVRDHTTTYRLGKSVKEAILELADPSGEPPTIEELMEAVRPLEVDRPPVDHKGSALEELAAHDRIYDICILNAPIEAEEVEDLVVYMMGGPPPVATLGTSKPPPRLTIKVPSSTSTRGSSTKSSKVSTSKLKSHRYHPYKRDESDEDD